MKLLLENVRTFNGNYELEISPITFLVGENSAGKSSLLASAAVVGDTRHFPFNPDFNADPYDLGNFNTIVTNRRGKQGNAKSFSLGFKRGTPRKGYGITATYTDNGGIPEISDLEITRSTYCLRMNRHNDTFHIQVEYRNSGKLELDISYSQLQIISKGGVDDFIFYVAREQYKKDIEAGQDNNRRNIIDEIMRSFNIRVVSDYRNQVSLSPIRSKPRRTYDEFKEDFTPEGGHVPFVLSKILSDRNKNEAIISKLKQFGESSGLFEDIKVRRLGKSYVDPFQIVVKSKGEESNISDVGYGVSQALPIIVECILAGEGTRILMQQPEVHLHPRAQAALGSFIAFMKRTSDQHYIIETHSDYLIDRVRIEALQKSVPYKDIGILYLEKSKGTTIVNEITLDQEGNTIGAPNSYREFFLEEQFKMLGGL